MNTSEPKPSLPTWVFVLTDLALIGAAAVVAARSAQPLSSGAMIAIIGLVSLGALILAIPLVARFEKQKNALLDDRQRALEALARTVSSSAEQISIATGSLHEIAEAAQKNLRQAEHLPHKLQEKIAEFQAQLAAANDAEKEELEKELTALRMSESERLEAVSTKIAKAAAEWTKLEAAAAKHLAAAQELMGRLPATAAESIAKAQSSAELALHEARSASARALAEAGGDAARVIAAAQAAGLAALKATVAEADSHLAGSTAKALERVAHELSARVAAVSAELDSRIARLEALVHQVETVARREEIASPPAPPQPAKEVAPPPVEPPAVSVGEAAKVAAPAEAAPPAPKRPRKPRRPAEPVPAPAAEAAPPAETSAGEAGSDGAASAAAAAVPPADQEPLPVPAEKFVEIAPVAPPTKDPFTSRLDVESAGAAAEAPAAPAAAETSVGPGRKRSPKKPATEPTPALDLPLDESAAGAAAAGTVERTLTSDGATRLLATAYIGIGNRLFIRGEGPGLSWDKGVPLQFVSIGKWRWETNEATGPVRYKLYKNDEQECTALGEHALEPGHLQEVTAPF
jgi:hypothetical protein